MKIILVRHGESTANADGLLSSLPSDKVALTQKGRSQVEMAAKLIRSKVNCVYVSPLLRTIETANILFYDWPEKPKTVIDPRIIEINYGIFSGKPNNPELDAVRKAQVNGNYLIRFGDKGENKLEILSRLYDFLIEVIEKHSSSERIVIVSHGSITGWLEKIIITLNENKIVHRHINNAEFLTYTLNKRDVKKLFRHKIVDKYCAKTENFSLVCKYRSSYIKLANLNDDVELDNYTLENLLKGFFESDIGIIMKNIGTKTLGVNEVVAVCTLHNSASIIGQYIDHYINIGVKSFVFIDNNSDDESLNIIKSKTSMGINVDIWQTKDRFDSFKAMGWKQRMFANYGINRWYLNLDVDELLVFIDYEKSSINELVRYAVENGLKSVGGVLIDMYSKGPILSDKLLFSNIASEYCYFDTGNYKYNQNDKFNDRIFGGPRMRLFKRHPSLQKFPLAYIDSETIAINPHFYYPYEVNQLSERLIGLLHYKFVPGDFERYINYAETGVHWDGSSQYKSYVDHVSKNRKASFYDKKYSTRYVDSRSLNKLVDEIGNKLIGGIYKKL